MEKRKSSGRSTAAVGIHLTALHEMGDGRRGGEVRGIGSSQPSFLLAERARPECARSMRAVKDRLAALYEE